MTTVNGYEHNCERGWNEQIPPGGQPAFDSYIEDTKVSRSAPLPYGMQV